MKIENTGRAPIHPDPAGSRLSAAIRTAARARRHPASGAAPHSGESGQSLVEFAMVAPLLLLAVTGILWFGLALNNYQVLTNAVGDGARAFALSRGQTTVTDPCAYAVTTVKGAAPNLTASQLTFTMIYTPTGGTAKTYSTTCSGITLNTGDTIEMTVTYPFAVNVLGWGAKQLTLSAQLTELVQ